MKQTALILGLVLALMLPQVATAGCYADYKAKQDNPLRLHYGVAEISQCSMGGAKTELAARLATRGWTLLNIVSVFDETGLEERKQSAGANFLRF
ncbi:hypothetical protein So717_09650 [Roseobacter cerasinus]|uniref:DUF4177 domain-containing protein n=1 Tax=Roseobacter cerasinus TaxID=2602289 RepID=A0A640VNH3_9RHOB|nr:hypothetical protein [Roseobacter cerasinus]GFE49212.1 hypothetical protein So717_09650 [Roseobacter cerasinus]